MTTKSTAVRVEAQRVDVSGHQLYAERLYPAEEQSATTLVFLHDALGSVRQWRGFPEEVVAATGCRGLVYDRLGHGSSDPMEIRRTPNYLEEEALQSLPALLAACDSRDVLFIGHSDGASIALIFAGKCPPSVVLRGVISEAAHVFVEDVTRAGIRQAVQLAAATLKNLAKYHGDKTQAVFEAWHKTWLMPDYEQWNIEGYLPTIRCPLLVIQGERDEYGSRAQVESIATKTGGAQKTLFIPNCGHIPHYQAHDLVLRAMVEFIARQMPRTIEISPQSE